MASRVLAIDCHLVISPGLPEADSESVYLPKAALLADSKYRVTDYSTPSLRVFPPASRVTVPHACVSVVVEEG